jgi:hypothetical protein
MSHVSAGIEPTFVRLMLSNIVTPMLQFLTVRAQHLVSAGLLQRPRYHGHQLKQMAAIPVLFCVLALCTGAWWAASDASAGMAYRYTQSMSNHPSGRHTDFVQRSSNEGHASSISGSLQGQCSRSMCCCVSREIYMSSKSWPEVVCDSSTGHATELCSEASVREAGGRTSCCDPPMTPSGCGI